MWIILFVFSASTFTAVIDTEAECDALQLLNIGYSRKIGQNTMILCARTAET